jgi:polyisoprenoid-binding protein YceI
MRIIRTACLIAAVYSCGAVAADRYTLDPLHTYPHFSVNHLGFSTTTGRFDKTSGSIVIDTEANTGSIDVTVDTASLSTAHQKRDEHLRSPDFFNTAQFPTMTFKADSLQIANGAVTSATGTLTLLGVSKPVTLTVNSFRCGIHPLNKKAMCGGDVSTKIKRSDFGMTKYIPVLGDEVTIAIQVEATKD